MVPSYGPINFPPPFRC